MSYQALYRKFRPDEFSKVQGQEAIVQTLRNQISVNRIGHAYLFCGTRGTGKTTVAKIFAKAVNCENPVEGSPCGKCKTCQAIASGASLNVIEIDAASNNGVDNIREIVNEVSFSPATGKKKVYIIDEVHMLSIGAFNALLKTLEEPPEYVIFILATTEVHKIPITILSRCQRYDFKRINIETIANHMRNLMEEEQIQVDEKALRYVAKIADGSLRDALSLLDQCLAFHFGKELSYDMVLDVLGAVDQEVFHDLFNYMTKNDVLSCITLLEDIVMQGRELTQFTNDYIWYLRNLLLVKGCDQVEEVLDVSSDNLNILKVQAESTEQNTLMRYIRIFSELAGQIKYAQSKRVLIEVAMIRACKPEMEADEISLVERIRLIEDRLKDGISVAVGSAPKIKQENRMSKQEREKFEKAVPDELKALIKKWNGIINSCSQPLKGYVKKAKLSLGADSSLQMVFEDENSYKFFVEDKEHHSEIRDILEKEIQKEIKLEYKLLKEDEDFNQSHIDLTQIIKMDIEEE